MIQTGKSSFTGNILKLMTGNITAQLLIVISLPIITRIFSPEVYGIAAVFVSITMIITSIASWNYELSIMLPEEDSKAANLFWVNCLINLFMCLIIFSIVVFFRKTISLWFDLPTLAKYLWLAPLIVMFQGLNSVFSYWLSRKNTFGVLAISRIAEASSRNAIILGIGLAGHVSPGVLIGGQIFGSIVSMTVLWRFLWRKDQDIIKKNTHFSEMWQLAKRYKEFPVYSTWSSLLFHAMNHIPTIFFAYFFSPIIAGLYSLGHRALNMPMGFLGDSISRAYFQKASEIKNRGNTILTVTERLFTRLLVLSFFPFIVLGVLGKDIFTVVFGSNWAEAGVYVQILCVWFILQFIYRPMSILFTVLEKQQKRLILNCILFAARVMSLTIGGVVGNARLALVLFAASGAIVLCCAIMWLMNLAGVSCGKTSGLFMKTLLYSFPFSITLIVTKSVLPQSLLPVVIGLILLACYFCIIGSREKDIRETVANLVCFEKIRNAIYLSKTK